MYYASEPLSILAFWLQFGLPLNVNGLLILRFLGFDTLDYVSHLTLEALIARSLGLGALDIEGPSILQALDVGVPCFEGP